MHFNREYLTSMLESLGPITITPNRKGSEKTGSGEGMEMRKREKTKDSIS